MVVSKVVVEVVMFRYGVGIMVMEIKTFKCASKILIKSQFVLTGIVTQTKNTVLGSVIIILAFWVVCFPFSLDLLIKYSECIDCEGNLEGFDRLLVVACSRLGILY